MQEAGPTPRRYFERHSNSTERILTRNTQVGLFLQIIAKAGPVPWPDLTLPEGRTVKACQVMLDKEKQKIKKAREAAGEEADAVLSSPKVCPGLKISC